MANKLFNSIFIKKENDQNIDYSKNYKDRIDNSIKLMKSYPESYPNKTSVIAGTYNFIMQELSKIDKDLYEEIFNELRKDNIHSIAKRFKK